VIDKGRTEGTKKTPERGGLNEAELLENQDKKI